MTMTMTQTVETTPATTPALKAARANYDRLTNSSYADSSSRQWRNIHFTDTGKARLAHTVGFLEMLHEFNPARAFSLADGLCKYLDYLNGYAGMIDSPEGNANHSGDPLQFPAYRVVLSDDGGIGSFGICWYRAVPHKRMMELAETIAEKMSQDKYGKSNLELDSETARPLWDESLEAAKTQLRLRKELEEYRMYRPTWDTDHKYGFSYEWMSYGFSHNGGLIYHCGKDITNGSWSTHT
jgi:hypothetical protein